MMPFRTILILLAAAHLTLAQEFEVVSIRPSGPSSVRGSDGGPGSKDPERYSFGRADLKILIMIAYDVENFQISSKANVDRDEFDLAAKIPPGAAKEQFRAMLQNMLADRFHLKLHIESRTFPASELTVAKGGAKLGGEVPPHKEGFPDVAPGRPGIASANTPNNGNIVTRIRAQREPLARLAELLRIGTDDPVIDKTGLTGAFDFTLEFEREDSPASTSTLPDLNSALQDQLGLRLVKTKAPFDVLVIDSVDRTPTGN